MARLHTGWRQILRHFGLTRLGDIRWDHRVNSQARLQEALADEQVHFVEGDIGLDDAGRPIMVHPPDRHSDLPLADWLLALVEAGKGAKLDIKDPAAVLPALALTADLVDGRIPVMVNADLFQGPGGPVPAFVPEEFVHAAAAMVPWAILSPGWAVGRGGQAYTPCMLAEMARLLAQVDMAVTLSVHAWLLFNSWPEFKWLLDEHPFTLTVWGRVEWVEIAQWLARYTDPHRTLYDIQDMDGRPIYVH